MNSVDYIKKLTSIPSPSGYTKDVIDYVRKEVEGFGYETSTTNKGGLLVTVKGEDDSKHKMVTAHIDTLGAMVKAIKEDGRLKMELIGGFGFPSIEGENVLIHSSLTDKVFTGTALIHQSSVHVYDDTTTAERNKKNMEIRIDEKTTSKKETEDLGIRVGDFISFDPRTIVTDSGFIKSRHLDDKASAGILISSLKWIKDENIKLPYSCQFYFSNNEEIGYGANSNIGEEVVEFLAVDMGAIGDDQASDEYTVSICAKDRTGTYNIDMRNHLTRLAIDNGIDYRVDLYPNYGSDASTALRAGHDIKHGLIGPGIESSHSYERTHLDSIRACEDLLHLYLLSELA